MAIVLLTGCSVATAVGCGSSDTPTDVVLDDTGAVDETATETGLADTGAPGDDTGAPGDDTGTTSETAVDTGTTSETAVDTGMTSETAVDSGTDTGVLVDSAVDGTVDSTVLTDTAADAPVVPTLSIADVTQAEGNTATTAYTFNVTLSSASTSPVTVNYATADGTATSATGDYVVNTGIITFPAGTTTQAVTVLVDGDTRYEKDETFTVTLSAPTGATLAKATGTGTITNDDTAPTFTINDVTAAEGNSGSTAFTFTVTLSKPSDVEAKVNYATADGTATAGTDYTAATGTLTFAPGDIAKTITVNATGDTTIEPSETFTVTLSAPVDATLARAVATGNIVNDDGAAGLPNVTINDVSVAEGNSGTTTATFTVTLSAASTSPVTVTYATSDGSATSGGIASTGGRDYDGATGTVTFAAGETTKTISILVNGDLIAEADERFNVNLSGATGALITDATGIGTITNDDLRPTISINDVSTAEGNTGTSPTTKVTFTVTLSAAAASNVTVQYATADGTATGSAFLAPMGTADYRSVAFGLLTFAPGETSKTITIEVRGDTTKEENETFFVNLSSPSANATIADPSGTGTITNDDP